MAEPEDVIMDGAYRATLAVRRLWARKTADKASDELPLSVVRGRLEFFVGAVFGGELSIIPADAPISPNLFVRLGKRIPRHLIERHCLASTDGVRLRLPPSVTEEPGGFSRRRNLPASRLASRCPGGQGDLSFSPP